MKKSITPSLFFLSTIFFAINSFALPTFNMAPGVTPISRDIYDLHMTIFLICVVIGIIVFSVMFYALVKHRKSIGHKPAPFHENTKLEIFWAVVPFLILVIMAVPATKVLSRMSDDSKADVNIKIVGYQWRWKYEYLDEGISYFSNLATPYDQIQNKKPKDKWYLLEVDKPLVVPIHKKIRFLVTSNDVIHSWWVPALGIKRDAIPGFIYESWARIERPGIYRGQCAELCGINHAYMPIVVKAVTDQEYRQWIAQNAAPGTVTPAVPAAQPPTTTQQPSTQPPAAQAQPAATVAAANLTKEELMKQGQNVYESKCLVCHQANGQGMPPAFPTLKNAPITTGPVTNHIDIVLNGVIKDGKPTAMQPFRDLLNDTDIAAVITYERNSWDNDKAGAQAGGIVQPEQVVAERKKTQPPR